MTGLITDPGFDINRTEDYKLSIQVSLDGFSFSVLHQKRKQLLALGGIPIELSSSRFLGRRFKEWVQTIEILKKKYNKTTILYYAESLTYIPSEFYEYNNLEVIGSLVFGNQNGNLYIDNHLTNASGNLLFSVSTNLIEELRQLFPEQKLLHPAAIIDNELKNLIDKKVSTLVIYFGKKSFILLMYISSQLTAINNYSYANSGDVVYYTIGAVKKLKIVPEKTALFLAGEISPNGEVHNSLKKFFNSTIFLIPEIRYDSEIFKEPLHKYIVLL